MSHKVFWNLYDGGIDSTETEYLAAFLTKEMGMHIAQ